MNIKSVLFALVGLVFIFVVLPFCGVNSYKFFGLRTEQIRNEIFKESTAYNEGSIRDLENLQMEYVKAKTLDQKEMLKQTILHRFSVFNVDKLPKNLKDFYITLKGE